MKRNSGRLLEIIALVLWALMYSMISSAVRGGGISVLPSVHLRVHQAVDFYDLSGTLDV